MPDHHRLTRYIVYVNGTAFMGMLRQNSTHPELFGPDFDCTHGPYVLAAEADAEIDRQRAEIEQLRTLLRIAQDEWYDDNGQWGDGFGLKHWTRKADALLSDESSFRETEQHRE